MRYFAGLDWSSKEHALCIVDERGQIVEETSVGHNADGLAALKRRLTKLKALRLAIERPSGVVVDTLIEAGIDVVAIHPNVVKATRPRYQKAGKTDRRDAYLLADLLRTDGERFDSLRPQSDEIKGLRALVRARDDLVGMRVALANQLRAALDAFWPGANAIFADIDSPIALDFVRKFSTPANAARLGEKRLAAFLAQKAYCGRRSAAELLERLKTAPLGRAGEIENDCRGVTVVAMANALAVLVAEIAELTARIEHDVAALADGRIVMSFPRSGRVCAAQILAELGTQRERFGSDEQLAAEAGVCPVTSESGKHRAVTYRWACNKRLRLALTTMADNSRHESTWAADVYRRARGRGHDHPHAIRVLARAWVRILWRCWHDRTTYDPSRHGRANALAIA